MELVIDHSPASEPTVAAAPSNVPVNLIVYVLSARRLATPEVKS